jgi:hypothetical protein
MRRALTLIAAMTVLLCCQAAFAQQQAPRGKIVTEDGKTIEVSAFKNLLGKYQCVYEGLERHIPLKDIASIESGGAKFEIGSLIAASPTAAYTATVTMKDGRKLSVEVPRGRHPIGILSDSSMDQLVFFTNDSLSGGSRQAKIKFDAVAKIVFD